MAPTDGSEPLVRTRWYDTFRGPTARKSQEVVDFPRGTAGKALVDSVCLTVVW